MASKIKAIRESAEKRSVTAACSKMAANVLLCWSVSVQGIRECEAFSRAALKTSLDPSLTAEQKSHNIAELNESILRHQHEFARSNALNAVINDRDNALWNTYAGINESEQDVSAKIADITETYNTCGRSRPDLYIQALSHTYAKKAELNILDHNDVTMFNDYIKQCIAISKNDDKSPPALAKAIKKQQITGNRTIFDRIPENTRQQPDSVSIMLHLYSGMAEGYAEFYDISPRKQQSCLDIIRSGGDRSRILEVHDMILSATTSPGDSRDNPLVQQHVIDALQTISSNHKLYTGQKGSAARNRITSNTVNAMHNGRLR